jgi:hypothetical protein
MFSAATTNQPANSPATFTQTYAARSIATAGLSLPLRNVTDCGHTAMRNQRDVANKLGGILFHDKPFLYLGYLASRMIVKELI